MYAAAAGHLQIVQSLVHSTPPRRKGSVQSPLDLQAGHVCDTKVQVDDVASTIGGSSGWFAGATALTFAARWGHAETALELMRSGASVNGPLADSDQEMNVATPLHVAAFNGHRSVVTLLLNHGADSSRCFHSLTPSQWAAKRNYPAIVEQIVAYNDGPCLSISSGVIAL